MRPLVAIIGRRAASVPILRFSATLAAEAMCEAVLSGGGEPVIFHGVGSVEPELSRRLTRFDAILLPGGADLGPELYDQAPLPTTVDVIPEQDDLDLATVWAALETGLPTLAICRGMQVLNVALGGTLTQDVKASAVLHRHSIHDVHVSPGSYLSTIVGSGRIPVSSYHHQVLDQLAPGLAVVARADDSVIEAVEHATADILAVQWHPEDLHTTSPTDGALFDDLVERAGRAKRKRI